MKDIHQLIEEKRAQVAKLQSQLEVLEELAGEIGGSRRAKRTGPAAAGRKGRRSPRGANQEKVLAVLGSTPARASDIAARAGLSAQAANQVLMALRKKGLAAKRGRGMYMAASKRSRATGGGKPRRAKTAHGGRKVKLARKAKEAPEAAAAS